MSAEPTQIPRQDSQASLEYLREKGQGIMLIRLACIVIGYVFGLFQTGYIIGKINHIDVRNYGSGNAGTTNAMRVLGKKAGIITFLGDAFKAIIAIAIERLLIGGIFYPDIELVLAFYTGLGVILGHNFPFYMNFKGGKGIAATAGLIVGIGNPVIVIISILIFSLTALISRYVSLASLFVVSGLFIQIIVFGNLGLLTGFTEATAVEIYIVMAVITLLAFIRHKDNIARLSHHSERKIGEKKENL